MTDIPTDADPSAPKLVSFATLRTIARQLPRYRYGAGAVGGAGGSGGGQPAAGGTGTLGRDKKVTRNATTASGLVTLDMVNGKLVSNIHGISLIQVNEYALREICIFCF
jgi:hypothetical protein